VAQPVTQPEIVFADGARPLYDQAGVLFRAL
jgi:hypothetical protein